MTILQCYDTILQSYNTGVSSIPGTSTGDLFDHSDALITITTSVVQNAEADDVEVIRDIMAKVDDRMANDKEVVISKMKKRQ